MEVVVRKTQICDTCNIEKDLIACFHKERKKLRNELITKQYYHLTCKECEEKVRIAFKAEHPFHKKVRDTVKYHAKKWHMKPISWMKRFGLSYDFFEQLFYEKYESNWCQQCKQGFDDIARMQLDMLVPTFDPTGSNWRVIHDWDNNAKGKKTFDTYDYECMNRFKEAQTTFNLSAPNIEIPKTPINKQLTFL